MNKGGDPKMILKRLNSAELILYVAWTVSNAWAVINVNANLQLHRGDSPIFKKSLSSTYFSILKQRSFEKPISGPVSILEFLCQIFTKDLNDICCE